MKEHRGTLILVLGILAIVFCQFLGPFAWIMGRNDLAEMAAGRMDKSGEGTTKAGMICGIVGTVLLGISLVFFVIYMFVIVAIIGAGAAGAAGAAGGLIGI